jgi:hypothetical protein
MRNAPKVVLNEEDRIWLEKVSRSRVKSVRLSERAAIVLMAADGKTNREISERLAITEEKAARWRGRFLARGRAGIESDAPGRGRKPKYSREVVLKADPLTPRRPSPSWPFPMRRAQKQSPSRHPHPREFFGGRL